MTFLGWVIAAFSISGMVSAIGFGYWINRRPSIEPLLLSIALQILGNILYAYAETFPTNRIYVVLFARSISGIDGGNYTFFT